MKIVMPVSSLVEMNEILKRKPDEIYCGLNFDDDISSNRREMGYANIKDYAELRNIIKIAHKNKIKVAFTINAQVYTPKQLTNIELELQKLSLIGIDSIITSSFDVIRSLGKYKDMKIIASSVMGIFNSQSISLLKKLGVSRVILPRDLTISEIKQIKNNCDIELEVFIIGWKCVNTDCFCFGFHESVDNKALPNLCCLDYKVYSKDNRARLDELEFTREAERSKNSCGACKIKDLSKAGIKYFKIVGRRLPLNEKLRLFDFISDVRTLDSKESIKSNYQTSFGIKCGNCYYGKKS